MSKTAENLKEALAGESQACSRYMAFSEKADKDGYPGVSKLFRAVAQAELVHARNHLKAMDAIQGTVDNIKLAIEGETHEFKKMYPAMIKDAVEEKEMDARHSFEYAMSIEMVHAKLLKKALDDPGANADAVYHICPECGHTVMGEAPKKCPYCGVDASKFIEVA